MRICSFLGVVAMATALFSCSNDTEKEWPDSPACENIKIKMTASLAGNGYGYDRAMTDYRLYYALYSQKDNNRLFLDSCSVTLDGLAKKMPLNFNLPEDGFYNMVIWVHENKTECPFRFSDLDSIHVDYDKDRQPVAYTGRMLNVSPTALQDTDLMLHNPFASLTVRSSAEDVRAALDAGYNLDNVRTSIQVSQVGTCYNALLGKVGNVNKVEWKESAPQAVDKDSTMVLYQSNLLASEKNRSDIDVKVSYDRNETETVEKRIGDVSFLKGNETAVTGCFLGYPIEFDVTVSDWSVHDNNVNM